MIEGMQDQLAAEIELEPTQATFRDQPITIRRGLSTETRQLVKSGYFAQGSFNADMLPQTPEPKISETLLIIADEFKIIEIEDLGYGYNLTLSPTL